MNAHKITFRAPFSQFFAAVRDFWGDDVHPDLGFLLVIVIWVLAAYPEAQSRRRSIRRLARSLPGNAALFTLTWKRLLYGFSGQVLKGLLRPNWLLLVDVLNDHSDNLLSCHSWVGTYRPTPKKSKSDPLDQPGTISNFKRCLAC